MKRAFFTVVATAAILMFNLYDIDGSGDKPRKKGKVKWFNASKGYGFITPDPDGNGIGVDEIFMHQTAIQMDGFRTLEEGVPVTFVVEQGPKGLQATDVILDADAPHAA